MFSLEHPAYRSSSRKSDCAAPMEWSGRFFVLVSLVCGRRKDYVKTAPCKAVAEHVAEACRVGSRGGRGNGTTDAATKALPHIWDSAACRNPVGGACATSGERLPRAGASSAAL
jgi:hypothetical protein